MNTKLHIKVFVFWLVALQLISPFLHAHLFGLGTVSNAGIHMHIDELEAASSNFKTATIHKQTIPEHSVGMITGFAEKLQFKALLPILLLIISLDLFLATRRRFYNPSKSPFIKPPPQDLHAARAPPFSS